MPPPRNLSPCAKKRLSGKTKQGVKRLNCPKGFRRDSRVSCDGLKTTRCRRRSSSSRSNSPSRRPPSSALKRVINCTSKLERFLADYDILRCEDVVECKDGEKKKKTLLAVFDKSVPMKDYKLVM